MGKLLKYEFLRRKTFLAVMAIVMVLLEAAVLFGIYKGGNWLLASVALTSVIVIGGLLMPLIDCIANYYSDYRNKHGYMIFLTPNSGYAIIGAKALASMIILVGMLLVVAGSVFASYRLALSIYPEVVNPVIESMKAQFPAEMLGISPAAAIAWFSGAALMQYMYNIMLVMLSITLAKTALPGKQFNAIFALLFYFGVSMAVETVNSIVLAGSGFVGDMIRAVSADNPLLINVGKYLIVGIVMYLIWMAVSYVVSSILVNRRTDL